MKEKFFSFGRYPKVKHRDIIKIIWKNELPDLSQFDSEILPVGLGKSYGDSCLNEDGIVINTTGLNKFIEFDKDNNLLTVESGVTLSDCLDFLIPRGYFLITTPGTKNITVGGAIANDVHGKNHHKSGTFGNHVESFRLLRSDNKIYNCSNSENIELYKATIGGLGLTGIIIDATFKVKPVETSYIDIKSIKFDNIYEFLEINSELEKKYEFTVSWIDSTASGSELGRGIYSAGNFSNHLCNKEKKESNKVIPFPIELPLINNITVKTFNSLFYNKQIKKIETETVHYNPFFYPLDKIDGWNKAYGKKGFIQYQFVIPFGHNIDNLIKILSVIANSGLSSFLTVLKTFGDVSSPGMLSFPRPGITMAIDFSMQNRKIFDVLKQTDEILKQTGGVIYPAKDARMSANNFQIFYPQWKEFSQYIDPKFSSSFWRRVINNKIK